MPRLPSPRCTIGTALALLPLALIPGGRAAAQEHEHPAGEHGELGRVDFAVSCSAEVAGDFETAVAMLHSFWFPEAAAAFRAVAAEDPSCGMAHWGLAVTLMGNPMGRSSPSPQNLAAGLAAAEKAVELTRSAPHREQMYADAVLSYYRDYEARDHLARMADLEEAFAALSQAHPEDMEATIFLARTMVANNPPDDATFDRLIRGARMMEPLFSQHPDHPGLAHYLIHAYDVPSLAESGSKAAFAYADIAPAAPHALHMPSHIFTRLGYWDESINTNIRSARAEPDSNAAVHPMDYMVYAYLQQGRDGEARKVVDRALEHASGNGYNFVAMPARYAVERSAWAEAAALTPPEGAVPYVEALVRFARAVGAARSGRPDDAQADVDALAGLRAELGRSTDPYWGTVVEAQRLAAAAWVARARGDDAAAVRLAREGADLEETIEKNPVTPGPILPARELEGDLLLELGRPADALASYLKTLQREPRRARTLYGAARAAELAGESATAAEKYRELLELMDRADATRSEIGAARRFLAGAR